MRLGNTHCLPGLGIVKEWVCSQMLLSAGNLTAEAEVSIGTMVGHEVHDVFGLFSSDASILRA